jgi:MFS family permease
MPAVTFLAAKYFNLHGTRSDHVFSIASGVISVIGFFAVSVAPIPSFLIMGQVILSIGSAFLITTRSLATSLVLPDHVGTLYSAIAIAKGLGVLVSGPLFANLYRLGMSIGKAWLGLPFLLVAVCYVFAVVAVWFVRIKPLHDDEEQEPLIC